MVKLYIMFDWILYKHRFTVEFIQTTELDSHIIQ